MLTPRELGMLSGVKRQIEIWAGTVGDPSRVEQDQVATLLRLCDIVRRAKTVEQAQRRLALLEAEVIEWLHIIRNDHRV